MTTITATITKQKLRPYRAFSIFEKNQMYWDAQSKITDDQIMIKFNCDEDTLLKCLNDVFVTCQQSQGFTRINSHK